MSKKVDIFAGLDYNTRQKRPAQPKPTVKPQTQPTQTQPAYSYGYNYNSTSTTSTSTYSTQNTTKSTQQTSPMTFDFTQMSSTKKETKQSDPNDLFGGLVYKGKKQTVNLNQNTTISNTNYNSNKQNTQNMQNDFFDTLLKSPSKSPDPQFAQNNNNSASNDLFDFLGTTSPSVQKSPSPQLKQSSPNVDFNDFGNFNSASPSQNTTEMKDKPQSNDPFDSFGSFESKPTQTEETFSNDFKGSAFDFGIPTTPLESEVKTETNENTSNTTENTTQTNNPMSFFDIPMNQNTSNTTQNTENTQTNTNGNMMDFFSSSAPATEEKKGNDLDDILGTGGEKKEDESKTIYGKLERITMENVNDWAFEKGTTQRKNLRSLLKNYHEVLWSDKKWKKLGMSDLCDYDSVIGWYKKAIVIVHPDKNQHRDKEQLECAQAISDHIVMAMRIFKKTERPK